MSTATADDPGPISATISFLDVLRGVRRRWLMVVAVMLFAFIASFSAVTVLKPVYSTEAKVLIENLETPFDRMQQIDNQQQGTIDDRVIASQMSVLESDDLGRRVVAALQLEANPEFNPLLRSQGTVGKLLLMLGFGEDPHLQTPEQRALSRYGKQLAIYQLPESNVINIKYSANDPQTAAKVANALADTYVLATRENQSQPTERAREWLAQQIDSLRKRLANSEAAVENFRASAGLFQGATTTLGTQEISELNTQITVAQGASADARARAQAIRKLLTSKGSVDNSSEVQASPAIQQLKQQRSEATRQVAELSATYLPNHPKMVAAQSQVANLDRLIRAEALKIVSGLEQQASIAEAREASLRASLEKMKSVESTANLDEVKLKALQRDAAADRVLLETMLSRFAEASSRQDLMSQPGMARIIQVAAVPTSPSFPKRGPMVLVVTLAGLAIGLGLAFLVEVMSAAANLTDRMRSAMEPHAAVPTAAEYQSPALVVQPSPHMAPARAVTSPVATLPAAPASAAQLAEDADWDGAARHLSSWALAVRKDAGASRIVLTSIGGGAGDCSVATMALVRAIARAGHKVIAVDLSAAGSWLETLCGVAGGAGLTDLVTGAADFTKVIGRDSKSPAHLLRYGSDRSEKAKGLLDEHLGGILDALGRSYEIVIANAGEAQYDTPLLIHKCHAALILAPATRMGDATEAAQALLSTGVRAARLVLLGPAKAAADSGPAAQNLRAVNA